MARNVKNMTDRLLRSNFVDFMVSSEDLLFDFDRKKKIFLPSSSKMGILRGIIKRILKNKSVKWHGLFIVKN